MILKNTVEGGNMSNGYYSYDDIDATGAQYRMVIGERSNGKTYGALLKIVENYIINKKQGAYLRRYREDFTGKRGQALFASIVKDGHIERLTNGEFNSVAYWAGAWYLQYQDGYQKALRDKTPMCYGFSINTMEHDKSSSYPDVNLIVFDEFLSRTFYLQNEFVLFMNVCSTIIRHKEDVVIYMLGNTVSKYSPYFNEMGITRIKEMKQGEIDVYKMGQTNLKVAIEYAPELSEDLKSTQDYFAFDNPALDMITNGGWELDLYPHMTYKVLPKNIKFIYFIEFDDELLQCEIIKDENGLYTFIHRKTTEIKSPKDLVFTTKVSANPNHHRRITTPTNEKTRLILNLLKSEKVFFQDNSVGETLRNYLMWCSKTGMFIN